LSAENVERIKRQNRKKISVVIGNPPYNANQLNENQNNKNREYPEIDKRIKDTYIAASAAQKTKLYDMYARFFRWASDRVDENGIIAFVSNSSFIERATFDGFRKAISDEFQEIWVIDLKGNARTSGERRRQEGGNIFADEIRVGIAVYFCVKKKAIRGCSVFYEAVRDFAKSDEKRDFLTRTALRRRPFQQIRPDSQGNWINIADNDFESLMPLASKETKAAKRRIRERAIFKLFSLGISTNRDEWLYDLDSSTLRKKVDFLIKCFEAHGPRDHEFGTQIKWSETLKRRAMNGAREDFDKRLVKHASYRPFFSLMLYQSNLFIDRPGASALMFPPDLENRAICFTDVGARSDYCVLAVNGIADLHFGSAVDAYQQVPLYRYERDERRVDNITDWAFQHFRKHYQSGRGKSERTITKEAIFDYVYGVLYDPAYREKYTLNLRRSFPRIPFYKDFWKWADWGHRLMDLHINYDSAAPWPLKRTDLLTDGRKPASNKDKSMARAEGQPSTNPSAKRIAEAPRAILRGERESARIVIDTQTTLEGIPDQAWKFRLGNRCALEWVLEQYKERKPKDPTLRENFDSYRFADYKERVIDLLMRVTRVSANSQEIVEAMSEVKMAERS
jgi:predicted helicase